MRYVVTILAALFAVATAAGQVRFEEGSPTQLRKMAAEGNKLIFMDLYADWCGPCQSMERRVFAREHVGEFMNEHFVSVRIDIETNEGAELAQAYNVRSIPTFLVFTPEMELVGRSAGFRTSERFVDDMRKIINHHLNRRK